MIKATIADILAAKSAIEKMLQNREREIDFTLAYWLNKAIRKIDAELEDYDKVRIDMIKRYGEEDKDKPGFYIIRDDCRDEYGNEMRKLLETQIEINAKPINIRLAEKEAIALADMMSLDFLFTDDGEHGDD